MRLTVLVTLPNFNGDLWRCCVRFLRMDTVDRKILSLLMEDGRRTYDEIAGQVELSPPSVKRRVDRLRDSGALHGFTAVVDHAALGWNTEALIELFYRPENELTRETVGTGIGLALVRQLAAAMRGRVEVRNCAPGAEFRVSFPSA